MPGPCSPPRSSGAAPVDGVVQGDVYLVGGGDPLLSEQWYTQPTRDTEAPAAARHVGRGTGRLVGGRGRHVDHRLGAGRRVALRRRDAPARLGQGRARHRRRRAGRCVGDRTTRSAGPGAIDTDPAAERGGHVPLGARATAGIAVGARRARVSHPDAVGVLATVTSVAAVGRGQRDARHERQPHGRDAGQGGRADGGVGRGTRAAGLQAISDRMVELGCGRRNVRAGRRFGPLARRTGSRAPALLTVLERGSATDVIGGGLAKAGRGGLDAGRQVHRGRPGGRPPGQDRQPHRGEGALRLLPRRRRRGRVRADPQRRHGRRSSRRRGASWAVRCSPRPGADPESFAPMSLAPVPSVGWRMLRRARITVAYLGTDLHGFAEADGVPTVMGELRAAMETVVRAPVAPVGAGRTDAGVHGWGQVVSLDLPETIDLADLQRRLNRMCGPAIAVRDAAWSEDPEFNARYDALWRHYRYHVHNGPVGDPFLAGTGLARPPAVAAVGDAARLRPADRRARLLVVLPPAEGRRGAPAAVDGPPGDQRRLARGRARTHPGLLRFEIRANAFCHQMVRVHRRDARRGRPRQAPRRRRARHPVAPRPCNRPAGGPAAGPRAVGGRLRCT